MATPLTEATNRACCLELLTMCDTSRGADLSVAANNCSLVQAVDGVCEVWGKMFQGLDLAGKPPLGVTASISGSQASCGHQQCISTKVAMWCLQQVAHKVHRSGMGANYCSNVQTVIRSLEGKRALPG
jgi:hypothetical protein